MADVKDAFYHGVRQQIGRVLEAMGEERVERGLRAFSEGASNWSSCFFAMAYPELNLQRDPENKIAEALGMPGNRVPMRIVYITFDGLSTVISRAELEAFIRSFLAKERSALVDKAVMDLIRSLSYDDVDKPLEFVEGCPYGE